jgi:holo-ACP synthase CitX
VLNQGAVLIEILNARDGRQEALVRVLGTGHAVLLFLSHNIPGQEKMPPGAKAFFSWMSARVETRFPTAANLASASDALGPYCILGLDDDPASVKRHCIALETEHPSSRLIDLDVYTPAGTQIDRTSLGLPARPCLLCNRRAVDCIRNKRHSLDEIVAKAHELLRPFQS